MPKPALDDGSRRSLGAYYPASHCILFDHPYAELQQACERLFGAAVTDPDYLDRTEVDWRKGVVFDDVLRVTTFEHELAHVRHLSASPLGFAMWALSGIERANNVRCLKNWSAGAGAPHRMSLPLLSNERGDPWLTEIARQRERRRSFELGLLRPAPDLELTDWLWPLQQFFDALRPFCENVLQQEHYGASILIPAEFPRNLSPRNFAGEDVIEGLARCNESIALIQLGAPPEILNRHVYSKHGQPAVAYISQGLGVSDAKAVILSAALLNWALQAPLLSFLLGERQWVEMHELLPGWRLVRLLARFAASSFAVDDVLRRHDEVEGELFASLGWASPRDLGERILGLDLPTPTSAGTRLAVRKLRLGAEIRARSPLALAYPLPAPEDDAFRASIAVFTDRRVLFLGDLKERAQDRDPLLLTFADDLIHDAVLDEQDVGRAQLLTDTLSGLMGGVPTGSEILRSRLGLMIGDAADEMLIAWRRSGAFREQ